MCNDFMTIISRFWRSTLLFFIIWFLKEKEGGMIYEYYGEAGKEKADSVDCLFGNRNNRDVFLSSWRR